MTRLIADPISSTQVLPRTWWFVTLLTLGSLLVWDATGWDLPVMLWLSDAKGFPLRHQWWLETVLHDTARQMATFIYLGLWVMVWRPVLAFRHFQRSERLEMAVGVTLALLAITAIKRQSLTSCPWDLQAFGGTLTYVSHWRLGVSDGGAGVCFPGGHASSALAFLALVLPGLARPPESTPYQGARRLLVVVLLAGATLGVVQTLRGAHYPSHTLWTAWICWVTAWLNHAAFGGWRGRSA
jgi:membrane-associated PAP2 superfamily phosphatase